jgi:hypothetical protein
MSIRSITFVNKLTILAVVLIAWFFLAGCSGERRANYLATKCEVATREVYLLELCLPDKECYLTKSEQRTLLWQQINVLKWCEAPKYE